MSAAWLVYALVVGVLIAIAAHVADALQGRRGAAQRWIWATALAFTCGLAAIAMFVPRAVHSEPTVNDAPGSQTDIAAFLSALRQTSAGAIAGSDRLIGTEAEMWLRVLLLGLTGAAMIIAVGTYVRFALIRRGLPLAELHGIPIRIAPHIGPAVIGIHRPEIIVPAWFIHRTTEEQRVVLSHETEHIRAGDPMLLAMAAGVLVFFPWHPAIWWMASRLRLAVETDCDRRVLARGVTPARYGTMLIDLAERCSGMAYGLAGLADRRSHLEWRIRTMTTPRTRISLARLGASATAVTALVVAACSMEAPTDVANVDAATVERSARAAGMLSKSASVRYVIDGKEVTAAAARGISANEIESIDVSRDQKNKTAEISIVTKAGADSFTVPGNKLKPAIDAGVAQQTDVSTGLRIRIATPYTLRTPEMKAAPLILVDGVETDAAALARLDASSIETVDVIKGPKARLLSANPLAANGVIRVTTRH